MEEISIVVPVYNTQYTLNYCINSIINQTYKNWRLILIDDGSIDLSGKVCDEYCKKDSRITTIHTRNCGVSSARNTGMKLVKTRYFCFVDSDDFLEPQFCEELMKAHDLYPDKHNIWIGFKTVNLEQATELHNYVYDTCSEYTVVSKKYLGTLHEKWLDAMPFGKLFDIDVIKKYAIKMPENLSLGEDLSFNLEYLKYSGESILIINKAMYNYVYSNQYSLSQKKRSNPFEIYLAINKKFIATAKEFGCNEEELEKCYKACFYKYEKALDNSRKGLDKIKYNNKILRADEFWECYIYGRPIIHFLYKLAYSTHNYLAVMIVDWLAKLKNS